MRTMILGALLGLSLPLGAFEWPHGARYAVSLTYDDALPTHLKHAWPALDKAGFRGTFFLCCSAFKDDASLKAWVPVGKAGHELGSHSLYHACARAKGLPTPPGGLEAYDFAQMEKELKESRRRLAALGVRSAGESFAFPCGDKFVGEERLDTRPLAARLFKAVRDAWGGMAAPDRVDLTAVPAIDGAKSGESLRSWAEHAEAKGGWAVFMFHGVGGDYLTTSLEAHQTLLDYLKSAEGLVWVAPFGEVAAWVRLQRSKAEN
jgi:peptidoglycan/xylan/chitin deacetylase (PgdA/CDA1 family)